MTVAGQGRKSWGLQCKLRKEEEEKREIIRITEEEKK